MSRKPKIRLDRMIVEKGFAATRQQARDLIVDGKILVNGQPGVKPGTQTHPDAKIAMLGEPVRFVSRGGYKLEAALKAFSIDVSHLTCLDVGASTGGFTDCLIQRGAGHVYAVDVGYGQMAWTLRQNPRVTVIERTNIRYIDPKKLPVEMDLITIDASFISLRLVVPAVLRFLKNDGILLPLIKPQFEVGKGKVGKGGVVREASVQTSVVELLRLFFSEIGLDCDSVIPSPILGPKGNREFMALLHHHHK